MTARENPYRISVENYLEGEMVSPIKHEYVRGQVYAMVGASDAHVTIVGNVFALLRNHLRGSGCRVYMTDMKVCLETSDIFYYPDVFVTCDERDRSFDYFKRYPRLIVEVLSPRTEAYDRGDKFADYRQLETLQEYVLISQERISVECLRRNTAGRWELHPYGEDGQVELISVDFRCPIGTLYEDVLLAGK